MKMRWLGVGLLGALGWAVGCGGNVVVDTGSGGGTGAGGSSTQGPGSSSSSSGGGPDAACQAACQALGQLGCLSDSVEQCVSDCKVLFEEPSCSAELEAYLQCLGANVTTCDLPPACIDASNAFDQCLNGGGCQNLECEGGSDGSCGCKGSCFGQDVAVECSPSPSGELACQCLMSGALVGTCVDSTAPCSPDTGCCAAFFFGEGG
jgi:hypothetical protein